MEQHVKIIMRSRVRILANIFSFFRFTANLVTEEDRIAFQNRLNEARRRADELTRKTNLQEANILRLVAFDSRIFHLLFYFFNRSTLS